MEKNITIHICPHCGKNVMQILHPQISVRDSEKQMILNGTLFDVTCDACGFVFSMPYEVWYYDDKRKVLIRLIVSGDSLAENTDQKLQKIVKSGFACRYVSSIDDLAEKVRIFSNGLDDRYVELLKAGFILDQRDRAGMAVERMVFERNSRGYLGFSLNGEGTRRGYVFFEKEAYDVLNSAYNGIIVDDYYVDTKWAFRILVG